MPIPNRLKTTVIILLVSLIIVSFTFGWYYTSTNSRILTLEQEIHSKNSTIDNLNSLSQKLQADLMLAGNNTSLEEEEVSLLELDYGVNIQVITDNASVTIPSDSLYLVGEWNLTVNNTLFGFYSPSVSSSGTTGGLTDNNSTNVLQFVLNVHSGTSEVQFLQKFLAPKLVLYFNNTGAQSVSFSYSTFLIWSG